MSDECRKITLTVPWWLVELADQLTGLLLFEPHTTPGLVNSVFLHNRAVALTHLAGRGVAHVEATVFGQIERQRRELEGWRTIRRFFARNRHATFVRRSDLGAEDHAALAIMTDWTDDEDGEGMPRGEVGHNLEGLEASLPRLEAAATP